MRPSLAVVALAFAFLGIALRLKPAPKAPAGFLEAEVAGLAGDPLGFHDAVLLVPKGKPLTKAMALIVGGSEGAAIALTISHQTAPRPLTADLLMQVIDRLRAKVTGLYIHSLKHDAYFARLAMQHDGRETSFDCRPSDGIALALRAGAPIYISQALFDEAAINIPRPGEERKPKENVEKGKPRDEDDAAESEDRGGGI